jgi:hypothetical protein
MSAFYHAPDFPHPLAAMGRAVIQAQQNPQPG